MSQDIVTSRLRLTSIEVSDTHVSFEIGSGGFSPFALVWDTDEGTVDAENPDNQDPVKTGDASDIALWCSILTAAFAAAASMALYRRKHTKN
jgi:hypothetical protein